MDAVDQSAVCKTYDQNFDRYNVAVLSDGHYHETAGYCHCGRLTVADVVYWVYEVLTP
jgi:hypothetical protein